MQKPVSEMTVSELRNAQNTYTLPVTIAKLREYLTATQRTDAVELLEKVVNKANVDTDYAIRLEDAFLRGSTLACREVLSDFGNYMESPRKTFPYYPFHDAVNAIDTALFHIKIGDEQQAIEDFNFLHN